MGSGPAGAILATTLAKSGKQVLLIEQGGRYTDEDRRRSIVEPRETVDYHGKHNGIDKNIHPKADTILATPDTPWFLGPESGDKELGYRLCFANGVGGGSVHWHGATPRPTVSDMTMRSTYGMGVDWPITYDELEPWLLAAEHELGVSGNDDNPYASPRSAPFPMKGFPSSYLSREHWTPAMKKLGWTTHSNPHAIASTPYRGRSSCMACRMCMRCQSGARYAADQSHIPEFEALPNGRLVSDMRLRRLETSANGKAIVAAHAVSVPDGEPLVIRADEYVLALGGVETPRMLLLSAGNGEHSAGLGNIGGQLGQRFGDTIWTATNLSLDFDPGYELGFGETACDAFRDLNRREHAGFVFYPMPSMLVGWVPDEFMPIENDTLDLMELRQRTSRICMLHAEAETGSLGTVTLDPEKKDAWGDPVARVAAKLDDWGMGALTAIDDASKKIADAMGAVAMEPTKGFIEGGHPWGATPMGTTPDEGVCDSNLRVFGLSNLHIVSGSVFPFRGAHNPTLLIVALALRLSNHLQRGAEP